MELFQDLKKQLDWFEKIGVDKFNFSVLAPGGMINHSLPRSSGQVLACAGWGWVKNNEGLNVYLRPAGDLFPFIFLDDLAAGLVFAVARKYNTLVVETSKNNHQIWIQTSQDLDTKQRFIVQKLIAAKVGADPGSTSGDHFGRAAGFLNRKPARGNWPVRVVVATTHCQPLNISLLEQNSSKPEAKPKQTHPLPAGGGGVLQGLPWLEGMKAGVSLVGRADGCALAATLKKGCAAWLRGRLGGGRGKMWERQKNMRCKPLKKRLQQLLDFCSSKTQAKLKQNRLRLNFVGGGLVNTPTSKKRSF